jgi:hypothetical protein
MYRKGIMQNVTTTRQAYGPSALHFEQLADSVVCDRLAVFRDCNSADIRLGVTTLDERWAWKMQAAKRDYILHPPPNVKLYLRNVTILQQMKQSCCPCQVIVSSYYAICWQVCQRLMYTVPSVGISVNYELSAGCGHLYVVPEISVLQFALQHVESHFGEVRRSCFKNQQQQLHCTALHTRPNVLFCITRYISRGGGFTHT